MAGEACRAREGDAREDLCGRPGWDRDVQRAAAREPEASKAGDRRARDRRARAQRVGRQAEANARAVVERITSLGWTIRPLHDHEEGR